MAAGGAADGRLHLWAADGKAVDAVTAHTGAVTGVAFHPQSSQLLTSGADGLIKLWGLPPVQNRVLAHPDGVRAIAATADGKRLVTGCADKQVRVWAVAINQLYQASRLSPDAGATMAHTLEIAGYRRVRSDWSECRSDALTLENMEMFYDEVRDRLQALGILSAEEIDEQQRLLRALPAEPLPAVWGIYRVACEA